MAAVLPAAAADLVPVGVAGSPGTAPIPDGPEAPKIASGVGNTGALAASDGAGPAADFPAADGSPAPDGCPAPRVGWANGAEGAPGDTVRPPTSPWSSDAGLPDTGAPLALGDTGIGPSGYSPRTEKPVSSFETAGAAAKSATTCARNKSRSRPRTPICVPNAANSPDNREISAGSIDVVMFSMLISRARRNMSRNHWCLSGIYSNSNRATESPGTTIPATPTTARPEPLCQADMVIRVGRAQ